MTNKWEKFCFWPLQFKSYETRVKPWTTLSETWGKNWISGGATEFEFESPHLLWFKIRMSSISVQNFYNFLVNDSMDIHSDQEEKTSTINLWINNFQLWAQYYIQYTRQSITVDIVWNMMETWKACYNCDVQWVTFTV